MISKAEEIPNRFDFATEAPRLLDAWESHGCFQADPNPQKTPFTIVIPPPNVTGALHLGHALNNTLQDILIRWHRMQGHESLWIPGTDHAGIATQAVVERRLKELENKTRHDLGRESLVQRIWEWKDQYEARILQQLKRMGCSCDWRRTRFTLDPMCARAVRTTFFDLFRKGWIYRGKRLVNWDTFLQTAVSDDEVFHETIKGHFWHLRYPILDSRPGDPDFAVVATTRPETMLGDTAVAVHPEPAKALDLVEADLQAKLAGASAKDRPALELQLQELQQRRENLLPNLIKLADMAKRGVQLRLPLANREIPLICDPWAKPELGSGCVKITPAHDPNDYEVGLRCQLPMLNILHPNGTLNENAGAYAGLTIAKARNKVVADLETQGFLVQVEDREIDLAHSDRSKTPIEPYLADQWFVRMDRLAQMAMDAVERGRVKIVPERYARGYLDWLSEKRDWPVGRQLWWGHQISIWSKPFNSRESCEAAQHAIERWPEFAQGKIACSIEEPHLLHVCVRDEDEPIQGKLEKEEFVRQEDVLDTWFSSALWPHSTLGWPEPTPELKYFYPTSTLITSRDIITLWVARMVLMGLNNVGEVPFREVFIHPKILDGFGETMSKSKGNGVDPIDIIDRFGPDALRFGLAWLTTETQDVRMPVQYECPHCQALIAQSKENRQLARIHCEKCGEAFSTQWAESEEDKALLRGAVVSERFEVARNFCNKLWNASRFVLMNLEGFQAGSVPSSDLRLEDRWILSRLASLTRNVTESLRHYRYAEAARELYEFSWDQFCSYYVEMAKPRLANPEHRATVQRVLAHTLDVTLRLLHPVIPFVTEAIWQHLNQIAPQRSIRESESPEPEPWLIRATWPTAHLQDIDEAIERQFAMFTSVVGAVREVRARQGVAPRELIRFVVQCSDDMAMLLKDMGPFFSSLANAQCLEAGQHAPLPALRAHVALGQADVFVDLSGLVDVDAEISRNEKLLENLTKQIQSKQNKLNNENFVSRAPADVVAKERDSLHELAHQKSAAEEVLAQLRSSKGV